MAMAKVLREKVRGWGKRSGVVLVMKDGRVIETLCVVDANRELPYALRERGDYDDLWFKVKPVDEMAECEAEYRGRYSLDRKLGKGDLRRLIGEG